MWIWNRDHKSSSEFGKNAQQSRVSIKEVAKQQQKGARDNSWIGESKGSWLSWIWIIFSDQSFGGFLKPSKFKAISYKLHFFSEASLRCYGSCCCYGSWIGDNAGNNYCSFIIGKAQVGSLKAVSIPRLELTAAVLSIRLYLLVTKELDLPNCNCVFWTDSRATLQCIQTNNKQFPVFVANRLAIICEHTSTNSLKYVSSKLNPVDFATRGISAELFSHSHAWLQGPLFLWKIDDLWPVGPPQSCLKSLLNFACQRSNFQSKTVVL